MLLAPEDIDALHEKISRLSPNPAEQGASTALGLDKTKALMQVAERRSYVAKYYASCLPLYDDWLYFMQISDFYDMKIYIDLCEISACYESTERFTDSLRKAIACFAEDQEIWHENTIADMCGHENRNTNKKRFSDFSEAYRMMNQKDIYGRFDKKIHLDKKMPYARKIRFYLLILGIIALVIAGVAFYLIK
jgi:hypothetical protein